VYTQVEEYWKRKKTLATADYAWEETSNLIGMKQCTEIAKRCVETDRKKRPTTKEIIDDLNKLNPKPLIGQVYIYRTHLIYSWVYILLYSIYLIYKGIIPLYHF
jgi:hypothetical protein